MHIELAEKFHELGVLKVGTTVVAEVMGSSIGGIPFSLEKELVISDINGKKYKGHAPKDVKDRHKFTVMDIIEIDGMEMDRLSQVYNLYEDGSARRVGKKPGRKPKNTQDWILTGTSGSWFIEKS